MMLQTPLPTAPAHGGSSHAPLRHTACDALSLYCSEIGTVPLLSREEEGDLLLRMRAGDEQAAHRLIEANLRLVVFVARWYRPSLSGSVEMADLIQAGNLGLMQAVTRYDPARGRFSTYAVYWIRQAISRTVAEQGRTMRLPAHLWTQVNRMARLALHFLEAQGKEASETQLAAAMGLAVEQLRSLARVGELPMSLDRPLGGQDNGPTLAHLLADTRHPEPEAAALLREARAGELAHTIGAALGCLTERERAAVVLRFGLDGTTERSLQQVGQQMGISRERARQLVASALVKLRTSTQAPALLHALRTGMLASQYERTPCHDRTICN